MSHLIYPANDFFIRYLWGAEHNKPLTLSFINSVLSDAHFKTITALEIKNPFNLKTFEDDKESVLDIKAWDEDGRIYNIEVQSQGNYEYPNRSLFYWARLFSDQLQEGTKYQKLQPVICINILNFILFKDLPDVHSCFMLREISDPEYVLTDHLQIHFMELMKLDAAQFPAVRKLLHWLYFLKNGHNEEDINMKILIRDDMDIKKAHDEYLKFSRDEQMKDIYEARLKRSLDQASALEEAREQGIKQGIEQGVEQNAGGLYRAGISIQMIMKGLGLEERKVIEILKKQGLL